MKKEQEKYQKFIYFLMSKSGFMAGRDIVENLKDKYGISGNNARKILQRTADTRMIDSTRPLTFGKGQYIYMLPGKTLDIPSIKLICEKYRPPLFRIIDVLEQNGGIISYYEALKLSAAPGEKTSTKANSVDELIHILVKLDLVTITNDENNIRYLVDKAIVDPASEMPDHFDRMMLDSMFLPDILRWLRKVNIIDNLKTVYRNKLNPSKGAVHNSLTWDAFAYTKTTGINDVHGKKAKDIRVQTLVVLDVVINRAYSQSDLDGFVGRVQVNLNSVKEGQRKVMPIIFYKEISAKVQNTISSLGFLSFDIGSVFGARIYEIVEKFKTIQDAAGDNDVAARVENTLSTIKQAGQDDNLSNLKGILFEFLIYPVLRSIYSNATILHGKYLSIKKDDGGKEGYEYDFIIRSENPKEIVVVETKGYWSENIIPVGRSNTNNTLSWFFGKTLPFLRNFYTKEINDGYKWKACYITSAGYLEDGITYLKGQGPLKPAKMEGFYDGSTLLKLLTDNDFPVIKDTLVRYYIKKTDS